MNFSGGASVAFKNALVGGVILALIEGVTVAVTAISMRRQYQMMEEMQKAEMDRMKKQLQRGRTTGPDASFSEGEHLIDRAKSFSF